MSCREDRGIGLAWSLTQKAHKLWGTDVPGKYVVARAAGRCPGMEEQKTKMAQMEIILRAK